MPRRKAKNTDQCQPRIVKALRDAGFHVTDMSGKGGGFPDLVVVNPDTGRVALLEAKTFANMRAGKIEQEVQYMMSLVTPGYRMLEDPEAAVHAMREQLL